MYFLLNLPFDVAVVILLFFSWLLIMFCVVSAATQSHFTITKQANGMMFHVCGTMCVSVGDMNICFDYIMKDNWVTLLESFNSKRSLTVCVSITF